MRVRYKDWERKTKYMTVTDMSKLKSRVWASKAKFLRFMALIIWVILGMKSLIGRGLRIRPYARPPPAGSATTQIRPGSPLPDRLLSYSAPWREIGGPLQYNLSEMPILCFPLKPKLMTPYIFLYPVRCVITIVAYIIVTMCLWGLSPAWV